MIISRSVDSDWGLLSRYVGRYAGTTWNVTKDVTAGTIDVVRECAPTIINVMGNATKIAVNTTMAGIDIVATGFPFWTEEFFPFGKRGAVVLTAFLILVLWQKRVKVSSLQTVNVNGMGSIFPQNGVSPAVPANTTKVCFEDYLNSSLAPEELRTEFWGAVANAQSENRFELFNKLSPEARINLVCFPKVSPEGSVYLTQDAWQAIYRKYLEPMIRMQNSNAALQFSGPQILALNRRSVSAVG